MAEFEPFFPHILRWEGGYADYKEDPGGCTKYGITIHTWKTFGYDKNGDGIITCEDVKRITEKDAEAIYERQFWYANNMHLVENQKLAELICDWCINSGAGVAIVRVQRILNELGEKLATDGVCGILTIIAINRHAKELYRRLWKAREIFYYDITKRNPAFRIFLQGWLNRLNSFPKEI